MDGHNEVPTTSRGNDEPANRIPSHFLVELTSLDELAFPANSTKRVKYTCVASTSKCLCLGTSTGSVYIFSRYAAKSRSRASSPVPVQVFTTRDGQISTISVSPSEELMAIGGDSGRVSIAQLNNGQPPTLVYSTPGDARSPDRVTSLAWSPDMKTVYSGHSSGALHCHRLTSRSVFRAAHQKLTKFDGEIVQLDTLQMHVLVATSISAHLYHVDTGTIQLVGNKKPRTTPSPLGACYIQDDGGSAFLVAARPNGRLWEANLVGVVYKTHEYRKHRDGTFIRYIPRAPPISFRTPFPTECSLFDGLHPENQDISIHKVHVIRVENGHLLIVSAVGSRICVTDMETSRCLLSAELDFEILDVSTCANDVFVLLADSKGLRKFSVFERHKCVEKLNLKGFYGQSAQAILFCSPHVSFPSPIISKTIEGLLTMSRKKETERLQALLQKILDDRKASQSMYDNMEEMERRESIKKGKIQNGEMKRESSKKLPSGVHRVLQTVQCSGYDDDFSFSTPQALRERSRSSPCSPDTPTTSPTPIEKRASEPSSLELRQEFWRKNGTPDVVEEDILHRARQILEDSEKLVEKESLRTLLQLEGIKRDEIRFTPTVTIGNAAKALAELALAVPVDLSTIWNNKEPKEISTSSEKSEKSTSSSSSKKPTIVKVVRPGIRPPKKEKPIATVSPRSPKDDIIEEQPSEDVASNNVTTTPAISEEMRRKQDEMWLDLRLSHIKKQSNPQSPSADTVPKSDTDYTITTDSDSVATPSGVWTNPLDEEDDLKTPTTSTSSEFNCSECGMHRSWAATALLMAVCSGADVVRDEFKRQGAIPQNSSDWERLLRHVASSEDSEDVTTICPRCEMSLSSVERVCAEGWRNGAGWVEDGVRPNVERIFERCMNSSREKLETIVARREEIQNPAMLQEPKKSEENAPNLTQKLESLSLKIQENHREKLDFSSPKIDSKDFSNDLRWLPAVPMKTFLALAVFTLGKKAVIQIISVDSQWIARRMKPQDWCSIVVMGTRETGFRDTLGMKTITSVLDSVGASGWVTPRKKKLATPSRIMSPVSTNSAQNPSTISSWIVDTNGKCPLCTLPIKMIVGGKDAGVVSYYCGHVFHKMCLSGRFITGCIACRVKARRAAAARASGSSTSSPNASPVMSPRHQRLG